jgi:hypothetical protein
MESPGIPGRFKERTTTCDTKVFWAFNHWVTSATFAEGKLGEK